MNTVKYFTKTFPSWTKVHGKMAEFCWSIVRETPESGYKKKKMKEEILKHSTRKAVFIESVKILCIND